MATNPQDTRRNDAEAFARAGEGSRDSIVSDYLQFLKRTKKWWLVPLIIMLLLFGVLFVLAATGVAPFVYTLF
jgi:hypothetical protein